MFTGSALGFSVVADSMPSGSCTKWYYTACAMSIFTMSIAYSAPVQLNAIALQVLGEEGHKIISMRECEDYSCVCALCM
jgi:hypothetical protein